MRLYKEYLDRHGIKVKLVEHVRNGAILFRVTNGPTPWMLVTIRWLDDPDHPGTYFIEYLTPNHDGYATRSATGTPAFFTKHHKKNAVVEWDDYEDFILGFVESVRKDNEAGPSHTEALTGRQQVILGTWEMFIYCYDSWFDSWVQVHSPDIQKSLADSTDRNLPLDQRYAAYQEVLARIATRQPTVSNNWKHEFMAQVLNYSEWLADLTLQPSESVV